MYIYNRGSCLLPIMAGERGKRFCRVAGDGHEAPGFHMPDRDQHLEVGEAGDVAPL